MQKQNKISEDIQLLIIDFLQNRIDQDNLTVLNSWLAESENSVSLFNEFKTYWLLTAKKQNEKILTDKALLNVKSALNESKIPKRFLWNSYKIAASWLIVFLLGSGLTSYYFSHFSDKNISEGNTSVFAPLGSTSYLDLPDGSKVWLNAGSKITYNNNFGKKSRILELTGEAFFSVKTNPKKPFLVVTSDLIVKATGTRFNVKAYPEEKTITTTLVEGKVIIEPVLKSEKNEIVVLNKKEKATYFRELAKETEVERPVIRDTVIYPKPVAKQIMVDKEIATELVTSWKEPTWVVEAEPLDKFAVLLERRYNVEIEFHAEEIKNYKFTGKIQNESIEQIMRAVELSAPITCSFNKNVIKISIEDQRKNKFRQFTN